LYQGNLRQRNICRLYTWFPTIHEGTCYVVLVLELCSRGNVKVMPGSPIPEGLAAQYTRGLASAVEFLHKKDIVHRDLKLENMLLDEFGLLKITDFGLSILSPERRTTYIGTPVYMAPEVGIQYGPKADVWSVGVIIYILLTATHPFEPTSYTDTGDFYDKLEERISSFNYHPLDPRISPEAAALVKRIFVPEGRRPAISDVVMDRWVASRAHPLPKKEEVPRGSIQCLVM